MSQAPLVRDSLSTLVRDAVRRLVENGSLPAAVLEASIEVDVPKQAGHGDFMTNFALVASKPAGMNPRAIAELLRSELQPPSEPHTSSTSYPSYFQEVEIAGPGFINFTLSTTWVSGFLAQVQSTDFAHSVASAPKRINVEFVSVNPNGPITVGSGRGAAYGSTLCNVLAAAGHTVHR
ncbi:MAG: arginine--tRNA ligase, partial [Armatimonadetes bacterium]|nr:arginine--tRNA ligase [Armatimonadota bacterium]